MRHLTVRNVPDALARELDRERLRRGQSLNQTVLDLLAQATGVSRQAAFDNGLGRFAGTWSAAELRAFDRATRAFEVVDKEMWR
jgi:hypothetical protein